MACDGSAAMASRALSMASFLLPRLSRLSVSFSSAAAFAGSGAAPAGGASGAAEAEGAAEATGSAEAAAEAEGAAVGEAEADAESAGSVTVTEDAGFTSEVVALGFGSTEATIDAAA